MELNNIGKDKTDKSVYKFTKDQHAAIDGIIDFIAKPFNPAKYIVGLTGAGGTGKTFITKYIITHCKYSNSVISCASPTHKACRVFSQAIGGKTVDTIQSIFGLRLNLNLEDFDPNTPQFDPMAKPKLNNVKLLMIDEASMLPAKLVTFICNRCKIAGIKIIFIGDSYQLAPVNENKSIAFDRCFKVYELTQIVRQGEDNPINGLLKLLRYDIKNNTYRFLNFIGKHLNTDSYNSNGEGYSICNITKFNNIIDKCFNDEAYKNDIDKYRIIAYTNNCVNGWNNYIRNKIICDSDKNIITKNDLIMSYETIVNDFLDIVINNSEEYIINDIVNFVDDTYGFKGFLVKFQLVHGGKITTPLFIIDHRDKFTIQKYHKVINDLINSAQKCTNSYRASLWKEYYKFKRKYLIATNIINQNGDIVYSRDIDYGFAMTAHKSQGSTYETVFIDVNNIIYNSMGMPYNNQDDLLRRLYVACSRAKTKLVLCYGS